MIQILFIEDEIKTHRVMKTILPKDYIVISCTTGHRGLTLLEEKQPDLVLLDLGLPDMDGFALLERILETPSPPPVVVLTACRDIRRAVEAIQLGAANYIPKPFGRAELLGAIRKAVRRAPGSGINCEGAETPLKQRITGNSDIMRSMRSNLRLYAERKVPVLITGESGTGKDLAARVLHDISPRQKNPFLALNCSAIPPNLFETELFGSERGAFTGAVSKPGYLERANGGTLFLDEIAEMDLLAQAKLLRVIEDQQVMHLGGVHKVTVDVRILAATNRPLEDLVRERTFREDLYYRLRVLHLDIPPLRKRREDIPDLVDLFLQEKQPRGGGVTNNALEKLMQHHWPGNVRELKSVLERAVVHAGEGPVERQHIRF